MMATFEFVKIKWSFLFIAVFGCLCSFSQATRVDTLQELESLKLLRTQLIEKTDSLQKQNNAKRILIDTITQKLNSIRATIAETRKLKGKVDKSDEIEIQELSDEVEKIKVNAAESIKVHTESRAFIKEIEARIEELSRTRKN